MERSLSRNIKMCWGLDLFWVHWLKCSRARQNNGDVDVTLLRRKLSFPLIYLIYFFFCIGHKHCLKTVFGHSCDLVQYWKLYMNTVNAAVHWENNVAQKSNASPDQFQHSLHSQQTTFCQRFVEPFGYKSIKNNQKPNLFVSRVLKESVIKSAGINIHNFCTLVQCLYAGMQSMQVFYFPDYFHAYASPVFLHSMTFLF